MSKKNKFCLPVHSSKPNLKDSTFKEDAAVVIRIPFHVDKKLAEEIIANTKEILGRPSQHEVLKLAARYALHLLYTKSHEMGEFGKSADHCNLWDLLQEGLGHHDEHPQVSLEEIISFVKKQLGDK